MDLQHTLSGAPHRDVFVLSGGAARGAVQVGMLEALLDAGIVPQALVGTSVGALNATYLGWRPDRDRVRELRGRWLALRTRDIFPGGTLTRVHHLVRQRPYLFSSASLRRLIDDWKPVDRLEDLPTPTRVVTTPLVGEAAVYHRSGDLADLLVASAAVPAVFAPVALPGPDGTTALHVDGGVGDNVPVAGAADLAPTRVWVLDASLPATRPPRGRTPVDVLVASLGVAMRAGRTPDLGPDVEVVRIISRDRDVRMTDFSMTPTHMNDGRQAAERALDAVHDAAVERLARRHETTGAPRRVLRLRGPRVA